MNKDLRHFLLNESYDVKLAGEWTDEILLRFRDALMLSSQQTCLGKKERILGRVSHAVTMATLHEKPVGEKYIAFRDAFHLNSKLLEKRISVEKFPFEAGEWFKYLENFLNPAFDATREQDGLRVNKLIRRAQRRLHVSTSISVDLDQLYSIRDNFLEEKLDIPFLEPLSEIFCDYEKLIFRYGTELSTLDLKIRFLDHFMEFGKHIISHRLCADLPLNLINMTDVFYQNKELVHFAEIRSQAHPVESEGIFNFFAAFMVSKEESPRVLPDFSRLRKLFRVACSISN